MLSLIRQARAAVALLLAASALWLSGCVTVAPASPATPEEVVSQRSQERWDALVAGNFEKAWTYASPATRAIVKQSEYHKRFGAAGSWKSARVFQVTCEPDKCLVRVDLATQLSAKGFKNQEIKAIIDETWVREDGQWWFQES